jgi:hypothetical protein
MKMQANWQVLRAMQHCPYKAWLLAKEQSNHPDTQRSGQDWSFVTLSGTEASIVIPSGKITPNDKLAIAAWCMDKSESIEIAQINFGVAESRLVYRNTPPLQNCHCRKRLFIQLFQLKLKCFVLFSAATVGIE